MSEPESQSQWPEATAALVEYHKSSGASNDELTTLLIQNLDFSTTYVAIRNQAEMDRVTYLKQGSVITARWSLAEPLALPPQQLFKDLLELGKAFLAGFVNPDQLKDVSEHAKMAKEDFDRIIGPVLFNGIDRKSWEALPEIPNAIIVVDSLIITIENNINEDGLVTMPPLKRKAFETFVAVGASLPSWSQSFSPN